MENFETVYCKDLEEVQLTYYGDLMIFDNYPIKHLEQIIDTDDVKYIIVVYSEGYMIVVTKHSYMERFKNKIVKKNLKNEQKFLQ